MAPLSFSRRQERRCITKLQSLTQTGLPELRITRPKQPITLLNRRLLIVAEKILTLMEIWNETKWFDIQTGFYLYGTFLLAPVTLTEYQNQICTLFLLIN